MSRHDPETVFVVRDAECIAETPAAIRVRAGDLEQDIWIPKSALHDDSEVYEERLAFGVAREQARKDLPLSNYTEVYLKGNLRDWLNMLAQRLDPHAQHEIRQYAQAIAEIVKAWCPLAWEAFVDYRLEARTFSRHEIEALRSSYASARKHAPDVAEKLIARLPAGVPESERREFLKALGLA